LKVELLKRQKVVDAEDMADHLEDMAEEEEILDR
jgi:hypothetical protein